MKNGAIGILALTCCGLGCARTTGQALPPFVERLIGSYESGVQTSSPGAIWKYEYEGVTVFYVPLARVCCDQMSVLYDADGDVLCAPDGGFAGGGDGRCPAFLARRSAGVRIWVDSRLAPE